MSRFEDFSKLELAILHSALGTCKICHPDVLGMLKEVGEELAKRELNKE